MACKNWLGDVTFNLGREGNRLRSYVHVVMPMGHGPGGVLPRWTWIGKPHKTGSANTREGTRVAPSRDLRERKMSQVGDKDKESSVGDGDNAKSNSNKTSNKDEQANCRKQMKKPRPAPNLVSDVFSPARS